MTQGAGDVAAAFQKVLEKCRSCGIDPGAFLQEKLLELEERKRILLTPGKRWFFNNFARYHEFAASSLGRALADEEKHGPHSLAEMIRRRFYPESRETFDEATRRRLLEDTDGRCATCGVPLTLQTMHVDHRVPLAEGGSNHTLNLQPLCTLCNTGKSAYFQETAAAAARPWWEARGPLTQGALQVTPTKRFCVLMRDNTSCRRCGLTARETSLNVVLRVPAERGGQAVYDNLLTACAACST
jgi:5-methylcytosine-specific restriction endonuclease McrA